MKQPRAALLAGVAAAHALLAWAAWQAVAPAPQRDVESHPARVLMVILQRSEERLPGQKAAQPVARARSTAVTAHTPSVALPLPPQAAEGTAAPAEPVATPRPAIADTASAATSPVPDVQVIAATTPSPPTPRQATPTTVQPLDDTENVVARADHRHCRPAAHPPALRERGLEGVVRLRVQVDAQGRAAQVQVQDTSGWRLFDEAAVQQVRDCRFIPALRSGRAVDSWVEFAVRFALAG